MKLGKSYFLTALIALACAWPVRAQNAPAPPSGQASIAPQAAFNNEPPPPAMPAFCPPGSTRNIVYPFGEGTDAYQPVGNAFFDPRAVEGPGPLPGQTGQTTAPDFYLGIGAMAMRRTQLNREQVAELAPPISYTSQNAVDLNSVPIPFLYGARVQAGINFGAGVLELSGFYLFPQSSSYSASAVVNPLIPNPLFGSQANFANYPIPAGFQGFWSNPANASAANSVYTVNLNYAMSVGNLELNYRTPIFDYTVFLIGLRYFDTSETIDIQTYNSVGSTDYFVGTRNRIIGPQIGFEFEYPLIRNVSVELTGKAAGGANFFYVTHTLSASNGAQGPSSDTNGFQPSGVFELGLFTNVWLNTNLKLHLGYQIMYILNVPEAQSQINFNTTVGSGNQDYHGSYFFQGPVIDLTWAF